MPKKCELTGVSPLKGHNVSHANNKTKRRFLPNLKKVRFKSIILNKSLKNVPGFELGSAVITESLKKFVSYNFYTGIKESG